MEKSKDRSICVEYENTQMVQGATGWLGTKSFIKLLK
jgi:hypothetical protein